MIIDCHNHPDWHGYNLERFLANMEENNISKTWLLTWECPADEYDCGYNKNTHPLLTERGPISFSRVLSYTERAPDKFIPGYAIDPRRPEAIDFLEAAYSIYGVRVYGELKLRMMYDNPDAIRMFRFCGRKKMPVIAHLDYEFERNTKYPRPSFWYGGGIEAFQRAIDKCPETIFLGHAPGFWAHISADEQYKTGSYPKGKVIPGGKLITLLRKYPNLYCDLSAGSGYNALNRDTVFAKEFLIEFQDRVLYARDYFDNCHQELLNSLNLPKEVLDKIYFKNAVKLVPLTK
jgi:predicted TIM-barrel fold metal-dependent hydrolase